MICFYVTIRLKQPSCLKPIVTRRYTVYKPLPFHVICWVLDSYICILNCHFSFDFINDVRCGSYVTTATTPLRLTSMCWGTSADTADHTILARFLLLSCLSEPGRVGRWQTAVAAFAYWSTSWFEQITVGKKHCGDSMNWWSLQQTFYLCWKFHGISPSRI